MRFPTAAALALALSLTGAAPPAFGQAAPATRARPVKNARPVRVVAAATPVPRAFPYPIETRTLKNGLKVVFVKLDSPGLAAFYTLVRTGSRNEVEAGHTGFAHFFEHMMFRGTKRHTEEQRNAIFKQLGVDSNAFTAEDMTAYTFFGPSAALPTIIELEADRFQHLQYSEHDFKTEAKAVLGEYNKSFANPVRKMEEVMLNTAFTRHTYKHTVIGFEDDIKAMPSRYAYSLKFFDRFYRPDNTTVMVVGDFDPAATMALIEKHYASWQGKAVAAKVVREPVQKAERKTTVQWPQPTLPRVMVGYHTPSLGEGQTGYRAAAIQNVLGPLLFGKSSPLFRELVLVRQTVESLEPQYYDHRDPNLFYYLVTLKDESKGPETLALIDKAVEELSRGQLDPRRLEDVKSNLRYSLLMGLETPAQIAETLVFMTSPLGDPETLNKLYAQVARLTVKDLAEFARRHLRTSNRTVVWLKPARGTSAAPSTTSAGNTGVR
jgi:zinc protease